MSKNVKVNDTTYNGVSVVELPLSSGSGKAQFKDVDEIMTPSGTKTITENGTHDVTNFAQAVVNVPVSGGNASGENTYEMGSFEITEECRNYIYNHNLGRVPKFAIIYPINVAVTEKTYAISTETIINGLGQEDYDISSNEQTLLSTPTPFVMWSGTGYMANVVGTGVATAKAGTTAYETVELTEKYAKVGSFNTQSANTGHLTVGTYGIILG